MKETNPEVFNTIKSEEKGGGEELYMVLLCECAQKTEAKVDTESRLVTFKGIPIRQLTDYAVAALEVKKCRKISSIG